MAKRGLYANINARKKLTPKEFAEVSAGVRLSSHEKYVQKE